MKQEKFNRASELQEEIDRLDRLIHQIENWAEDETTLNPHISDYGYLVHLLGKDDVLGYMRTRKRMLEKEFEEL